MLNLITCLSLIVLLSVLNTVMLQNFFQAYAPQSLNLFKNNLPQAFADDHSSLISFNYTIFSNSSLGTRLVWNQSLTKESMIQSKDMATEHCKNFRNCLTCVARSKCTWCTIWKGCVDKQICRDSYKLQTCAPIVISQNRKYEWPSFSSKLVLIGLAFQLSLNKEEIFIHLVNKTCEVKLWTFSKLICEIPKVFNASKGYMKITLDKKEFIVGNFEFHEPVIYNISPNFIVAERDSKIKINSGYVKDEEIREISFGSYRCVNYTHKSNEIGCYLKANEKNNLTQLVLAPLRIVFIRATKIFFLNSSLVLAPAPFLTQEPVTIYQNKTPSKIVFHGQYFYNVSTEAYKMIIWPNCFNQELNVTNECTVDNSQQISCLLSSLPQDCWSNLTKSIIPAYISQSNFGFMNNVTIKLIKFKNQSNLVRFVSRPNSYELLINGSGFTAVTLDALSVFCNNQNTSFACDEKKVVNNSQISCKFDFKQKCINTCYLDGCYENKPIKFGSLFITDYESVYYLYIYLFILMVTFTGSLIYLVFVKKNDDITKKINGKK